MKKKERDGREGGMNQVRERRVQRGNIYDYLPCVYAAILGVYSGMSVVLSSPLIDGWSFPLFFRGGPSLCGHWDLHSNGWELTALEFQIHKDAQVNRYADVGAQTFEALETVRMRR